MGFTFGPGIGSAQRPGIVQVIGKTGLDATHAFFLVDKTLRTCDGIVVLSHVGTVFEHGDVALQRIPIPTPAQFVTVNLDGLGVEVLDVIAAANITQETLDIGQRETLAEIDENILRTADVIDRAEVVEGVFVLQRAAGQHLGHPHLPDAAKGSAVGDVAVNPLMPRTAAHRRAVSSRRCPSSTGQRARWCWFRCRGQMHSADPSAYRPTHRRCSGRRAG
ncbi:hypothetical protein D3C75_875490 [compost metagenome]